MMAKRKTTGAPILPAHLFDEIYQLWGEDGAVEILDKVQLGEMTVEQVETALRRPDIQPEDWQRFEEGWRPDGW
jgi:CTP:molybdopterin cytidylyltransferase MocA